MKRSQRYRAAVATALVSASISPRLLAQAPPVTEATGFEFHAPEGCSSAEDFTARVRQRSWRIRLQPGAGSTARSLRVEIQPPGSGGALRGIVTVVEADGAVRTRQLKAASCEEAVNALSLIATVTLDPDAMLGEPAPQSQPQPPPVAPKPPVPVAASSPRPRRPPAPRLRFGVGLSATLLLRMAPKPAPGGTAFVSLELQPQAVFSPLLRLALTHAQRRAVAAAGGDLNFAFTLPTLDVCPVRFGPPMFGLRPCAFASTGLLETWGSETSHAETHARFYGQVGAALLARLRVSEAFEIIADGRASLPFARDQYGFDRASAFTTPIPGFSASLGAAGGFP